MNKEEIKESEELVDAETAESAEDTNLDEQPEKSDESTANTPRKRRFSRRWLILISVLGIILAALGALVLYAALPHATEINEPISLNITKHPFLASIYEVESDLAKIDTNRLGNHPIKIKILGFLPIRSSVDVRDGISPRVSTHNLTAVRETVLLPEDFVSESYDATALTFSFVTPPDTELGGTVTICATDECGNKTIVIAELSISDKISHREIELGSTEDELLALIGAMDGFSLSEIGDTDLNTCGVYRIFGTLDGDRCVFALTVRDTTAPLAKVVSHDVLVGTKLEAEDFLTDIYDLSPVKIYYRDEPSFDEPARFSVGIIIEDEHKNITELSARLNIHGIPGTFTIEAGSENAVLSDMLADLTDTEAEYLHLSDDTDISRLGMGAHEIFLEGEYSKIPIELTVVDTTAPLLVLRERMVHPGADPGAEHFIESCTDATDVTFELSGELDTSRMGEYVVTVRATDAAGNFTIKSTTATVAKDTTPPKISGVKKLTVYEGGTLFYRTGVTATDDFDGRVTVNVDSSKVKTDVLGTYSVTYTATDKSGNSASVTTTVTVIPVTLGAVYELADEILEKILTYSMTPHARALAIYDWCTENIKYSTNTSHLMGYFNKAAYSGFVKRQGNCYTYYAVASALLTRAGIVNMEIHRNDPNRPHYWNLVYVDGGWYHFDTCPQPRPNKLKVFLLTDSELREFPLSYYYSFNTRYYPKTP